LPLLEKKVLVTGAAGFVGRRLCHELEGRGWTVLAGVRKAAGVDLSLQRGGLVETGDLEEQEKWPELLAGCQALVHLAGRVHVMRERAIDPLNQYLRSNTEVTRRLAEAAARAGVRRFLFASTIKVNGEHTPAAGEDGGWPEDKPPVPVDPYAISKARAEEAVRNVGLDTGMEYVIVRPPLVYGTGVKANFLNLMRLVDWGLPLPLASVVNRRSLIGVGNLADFFACCLEHPGAANQVFQVADDSSLSTPQLIRALGLALGRPVHLYRVPPVLLKWAAKLLGRKDVWERLGGSLEVDSGKALKILGWQPPYRLAEELEATASWYRQTRAGNGDEL
jgi:nucleoside-diphosphate-sugar epimerase